MEGGFFFGRQFRRVFQERVSTTMANTITILHRYVLVGWWHLWFLLCAEIKSTSNSSTPFRLGTSTSTGFEPRQYVRSGPPTMLFTARKATATKRSLWQLNICRSYARHHIKLMPDVDVPKARRGRKRRNPYNPTHIRPVPSSDPCAEM